MDDANAGRRALISVADNTGVVEFAKGLYAIGYEILSAGGTAEYLRANGVKVTETESFGLSGAGVVAINIPKFSDIALKRGIVLDTVIESISVRESAVLREAAKRWRDVVTVIDPADYTKILKWLRKSGVDSDDKYDLACKVFECTAAYDALVSSYMRQQQDNSPLFPQSLTLTYERVRSMRYGENPHQRAAFYRELRAVDNGMASAVRVSGREPGYNDIVDANLALDIIKEYSVVVPCAVAVNCSNPCGVGIGETLEDAYIEAYESDTASIENGILVFNREVDRAMARRLSEITLRMVIAPTFSDDAVELLKNEDTPILVSLNELNIPNHYGMLDMKKVAGGLLVQELDTELYDEIDLKTVTKRAPTKREITQLMFAWRVAKHTKSSSVVLVKGNSTIGIGSGQTVRLDALELALHKAGKQNALGSVMATDGQFNTPECIEAAAKAGITAIIQPGGSDRDGECIAACDEHNIAVVFTGMRHLRH